MSKPEHLETRTGLPVDCYPSKKQVMQMVCPDAHVISACSHLALDASLIDHAMWVLVKKTLLNGELDARP